MIRPLALLLALATRAALVTGAAPALATQDGWPALHDVAGVAADDALNVRAFPSASAGIVGTLRPDATGVEVVRPTDDLGWGLVNVGEGTGWVSLAFLDRQPGQWFGAPPALASCFGTEPFWTLTFAGDDLTLSTPEREVPGRVLSRPAPSGDRRRHGLVMAFEGLRVASVRYEPCDDGMSDRAYGLGIDVIADADLLSGCCTLQSR